MILGRIALLLGILSAAGISGAESSIEVRGTVAAPVLVSLETAAQRFHYAGCPSVVSAMPRVGVAMARLRGFEADPECAQLAPKAVTSRTKPIDDGAIRVLFIGNSLTYFNELPWMLEQLAASRGIELQAAFEGRSGADLQQQWERGRAVARIREGRWDWVVLQDQSRASILKPDVLPEYGQRFDREIRKAGARTMLFLTWAHASRPAEQAAITRSHEHAASRFGATIAPVGMVWERLRGRMQLFDGSEMHPNVAGTYLAACVFFTAIARQSPVGLPYRFDVRFEIPEFHRVSLERDTIDALHAEAIQRGVWEEMRARVQPPGSAAERAASGVRER